MPKIQPQNTEYTRWKLKYENGDFTKYYEGFRNPETKIINGTCFMLDF